jgi:hypothetical protein
MKRFSLSRKHLIGLALLIVGAATFAWYSSEKGISYKELIVGLSVLIIGVIIFGGEMGIRLGLVLWALTLALGYRTIELTPDLRIHPSEILLWGLLLCVFAQRRFIDSRQISFPWWLWLSIPFWALAWWPLIGGDAPWDKMLNEFRDFLLIIPLMVVAAVVLQNKRYWRYLLIAFFIVGTWIALLGVLEYWLPGLSRYFPAFVKDAKSITTADYFARASFSFWGGPAATFICALTLPLAIVLGSWTRSLTRLAVIVAALLHILAIYIGGYRSVWFILMAQILVACLLGFRKRGVALAVLALVFAIGGYQFVPNTHERVMTGIAALRGQPIDHSAQQRQERAVEAIDSAFSTPLGKGWAGIGWAHSDFLQIAANLGILAGLIFLGGYINTLIRLSRRALADFRLCARNDLSLSLLVSFIAAGGMLLMEGVSVLPQVALPVWFVWVLVEVRLQQMSEVPLSEELVKVRYGYPLIPAASFSQFKANV